MGFVTLAYQEIILVHKHACLYKMHYQELISASNFSIEQNVRIAGLFLKERHRSTKWVGVVWLNVLEILKTRTNLTTTNVLHHMYEMAITE